MVSDFVRTVTVRDRPEVGRAFLSSTTRWAGKESGFFSRASIRTVTVWDTPPS
jgi:hypothetical protein